MTETDRFSDWDAAYLLGSLTPQERHAYEDHLVGCPSCREAVGELAAMPGLLAQLPAAEAIALNDDLRLSETGPDSSMPQSISALRPPQRTSRRTMIIMVVVIMLTLVIGGIAGYLIRSAVAPAQPEPAPSAPGSAVRVAFQPVQGSRMIAVADVTPERGGTRIDVDCQYDSQGSKPGAHSYRLYVIDHSGKRVESTAWSAEPGTAGTPQLRSRLPMSGIDALEITLADNDMVLMRAPVP